MKNFRVELKKVVDDSYDVEIGRNLIPQLIKDIKKGLTGNIKKFAVITDSTVERLYATPILVELHRSGFKSDIFVFPAGEKSKVRKTKEELEDAMLAKGYRRDCCVIAVWRRRSNGSGRISGRYLRPWYSIYSILPLLIWQQRMLP